MAETTLNLDNLEEDKLVNYRITKLEEQSLELKSDLKEMMKLLVGLDKKLSMFPNEGFQCELHSQLINNLKKDVSKHNRVIEGLQAFRWKSIGVISLIIIIIQVFVSVAINRSMTPRKTTNLSPSLRIELITPTSTNLIAGTSSTMTSPIIKH